MVGQTKPGGVLVDFEPMSPEERERTMQFLLRQQAQFAADFARSQERLDRVEDALVGLTGIVGRQADNHEQLAKHVADLRGAQAATDVQLRRTDERLDIVIALFERHLRADHGIQ